MVISHLTVLAYARGCTVWLYRAKAFERVLAAGYCDRAAGMLENNDVLLITAADAAGWRRVAIADGAVTLHALN